MHLHDSLSCLLSHGSPAIALTFGNFDGVHLGHQTLLQELKKKASAENQALVVITFNPHPRKILQSHAERFLLGSYGQRRKWLADAGVDHLIEIPFTRDFSTLSAAAFLDEHVLTYTNIKSIFLGWDFAFGSNKEGDATFVKEHCRNRGVRVEVCPAYPVGELKVSSSIVRENLQQGNMETTRLLLGRYFALDGIVVRGEGRGRKIGIPTANLQLDSDIIIPQKGVYVSESACRGLVYRSVTNIGHNPTFEAEKALTVETHLIDYTGDLYGENLEIRFLSRLRDERRFPTVNDLIAQLHQDIHTGRGFIID
jgi:riboflavin kinase / FMN adenylyltransferase